ncbi:hypothetical protein CC2G_008258 [Coprinopsis cinerea AmutBmut pab1-1]|nr:hypothetical protein CC2G_008258 [Coprinopsis cinerea AmutBmut pab1-1]
MSPAPPNAEDVDLLAIADPMIALDYLHEKAIYFHQLCFTKYTAPTEPLPHPDWLDLAERLQLYAASDLVMAALKNQIVIDVKLQTLAMQEKSTQAVDPQFPPKQDGVSRLISGPVHICDSNGHVLSICPRRFDRISIALGNLSIFPRTGGISPALGHSH